MKIGRVRFKTTVPGGRVEVTLHDGRNLLVAANSPYKVGDSLKLDLPCQKVVGHLPLATGHLAYVAGGSHVGRGRPRRAGRGPQLLAAEPGPLQGGVLHDQGVRLHRRGASPRRSRCRRASPDESDAAAAPPAAASAERNPWREVRVIKVVVNSGVGESGDPRTKAEKVLQMITHQKPVATRALSTNRDFGIRQGQEIGAKVTLRGAAAVEFLDRAFEARDRQLDPLSIDRNGNVSFGIADYTDFTGMKYDPEIGIRGMDICVELGRAG